MPELKLSKSKSSKRSPTKSKTSKKSKKSKKSPKHEVKKQETKKQEINKKESSLARRVRERKERAEAEKLAKKQQEIDAQNEEERKHKVIYKYMEKLDAKLKETIGQGFWVWVDDPKFKKILDMGKSDLQKMILKNVDKYKGTRLAEIYIRSSHKDHGKKSMLFANKDTWINCAIGIFNIDDKGVLKYMQGCIWSWRTDDFKISKFSYKLIRHLMHIIDRGIYKCGMLDGEPLSYMLKNMKQRGAKFPKDILVPLSGV